MRICTWNLNNRVGKVKFIQEAAEAVLTLDCDVIVLTEYFPGSHHDAFVAALRAGGLKHVRVSSESNERANRVLIAANQPLEDGTVAAPGFDVHAASNWLSVRLPRDKLSILGVRVPWYEGSQQPLVSRAWDHLENVATTLREQRGSLILGDLNVTMRSGAGRGGDHFRRILASGWLRAEPKGHSFLGAEGDEQIDHVLCTPEARLVSAELVHQRGDFEFCGAKGMSDHAVLLVEALFPSEASDSFFYKGVDETVESDSAREDRRQAMREAGLTDEEVDRLL